MSALDDVRERVEALARRSPGAVELARVLSPAVRVEAELIRQARLQLLPGVAAAAEAELWFSDLVEAQGGGGVVLDPEVADHLRHELAEKPARLAEAWGLIESFHRDRGVAWSIRVEEKIQHLLLADPDGAGRSIEELLLAAARRMVEENRPLGTARWLLRALLRLPPAVRDSPAGRVLELGAAVHVDGRAPAPEGDELPADAMESWLPWLLPADMATVPVGVRLVAGSLEIGSLEGDDVATLSLPATEPLLVELAWHDGEKAHRRLVQLGEDERRRIAVAARSVELRDVRGARHRLRPADAPAPAGGFDFSALRARHRPFFGREEELARIEQAIVGSAGEMRGWITITGERGVGKTALLVRLLDRLEGLGVAVACHFLKGGPESWNDPAVLERSLIDQVGVRFPDEYERLVDVVNAMASLRAVGTEGGPKARLALVVDGIDPQEDFSAHMGILPSLPPPGVFVVVTMSRHSAVLDWLEKGDPTVHVPLSEESSRRVCELYLGHHEAALRARLGRADRPFVHLSFPASEEDGAQRLATRLVEAGFETLVRFRYPLGSEPFPEEVARQIARSDAAVVFRTSFANLDDDRSWVEKEIDLLGGRPADLPIIELFDPTAPSRYEDLHLRDRATELPFSPAMRGSTLHQLVLKLAPLLAGSEDPEVLLERSAGHVGTLVELCAWILEQPPPVDLEHLPPTLGGDGTGEWQRYQRSEGAAFERAMALLVAAREPLAEAVLAALLEADAGADAGGAVLSALAAGGWTRPVAGEVHPRDGEESGRLVAVSHATVAALARRQLTEMALTEAHRSLALIGDGGYFSMTAAGWEQDYHRRSRLHHLLALGGKEAERRFRDVGWMTERAVRDGAEALFADIDAVLAAQGTTEDDADMPQRPTRLASIAAALRGEASWLRREPAALPALLHAGLRAAGWNERAVGSELDFGEHMPLLRRRQVVTRSGLRVEVSSPADAELNCAVLASRSNLVAGDINGGMWSWSIGGLVAPPVSLDGHRGPVRALEVSPDGKWLLSAGEDGAMILREVGGRRWRLRYSLNRPVVLVRFLADSVRFVAATADGALRLFSVEEMEPLNFFFGHTASVTCLAVTEADELLVSGAEDGTLRVWRLADGREQHLLTGHRGAVRACVVTRLGKILSASDDGLIKMWTQGRDVLTLGGHRGPVLDLCLLEPGQERLVSVSADATARVWSLRQGAEERVLTGHDDAVIDCKQFRGDRFATASRDGVVRLWSWRSDRAVGAVAGGALAFQPRGPKKFSFGTAISGRSVTTFALDAVGDPVLRCAIQNDRVVSCGRGGLLDLWELGEDGSLKNVAAHGPSDEGDNFVLCASARHARVFAGVSRQGALLRLDDFVRLTLIGEIDPTSLGLSATGDRAFLGLADGGVDSAAFDAAEDSAPLGRKRGGRGHDGPVRDLAVDADGRWLVSASDDATLRIWKADSLRPTQRLRGHAGPVLGCDARPDFTRLVSASADGTLRLWDGDTGETLQTFTGHEAAVTACVFAGPDRVASCSLDRTIRVWDAETGEVVGTAYGRAPFHSIDATLDGTTIVAGDEASSLWVLDLG